MTVSECPSSSKPGFFTWYRAAVTIIIGVIVIGAVWISPPSFTYSQLSSSQLETLFGNRVSKDDLQFSSNWLVPNSTSAHSEGSSSVSSQRTTTPAALLPKLPTEKGNVDAILPSTALPLSPMAAVHIGSVPSHMAAVQSAPAPSPIYPDLVDSETRQDLGQLLQDDPELQPQESEPEEKFIFPLLSFQVGTGNQLMEYKSAAVIARTLNRTLCLTPFFSGPGRHFGFLGNRHTGNYIEDRYDTNVLSRFVKVSRLQDCLQKCERKLDAHWRLRATRPPQWDSWFKKIPKVSVDFDRNTPKWSSVRDMLYYLGPRNDAKCVGLGGLFPGLRWKGVFLATSAYLEPSKIATNAANTFQRRAIGSERFIAVHWRFEESNCRGHPLGLCFSRCTDGSVIANGRKSEKWGTMKREGRIAGGKEGFNGVSVTQEDISAAISARAARANVTNVYLSTDGWLRGPVSTEILVWVVNSLRRKNLNVAGMWQIAGLPNFVDGTYVNPGTIAKLFGVARKEEVSNPMIALVEQEICTRSSVFVGSGQSSWSMAVFDTRRGRQCKQNIEQRLQEQGQNISADRDAVDRKVIDDILTIQYTPGPVCRGSKNGTAEKEDDSLVGWLDYDACEGQLDVGGKCVRIAA